MAIKITLARRERRAHQRNAWIFFFVLAIISLIFIGFGLRFLKPRLMLILLGGVGLLQFMIFLYAEKLVCLLMSCREPQTDERKRLHPLLGELAHKAGFKTPPTLYVSEWEKPNAFAFGTGLSGSCAIAVTKEILALLDDEELTAVLAHELGHLKAHDTSLMTLVAITLGVMGRIVERFYAIGRLAFVFALILEVVIYLPRVIAAAIAQLRELAADAYAVILTGSTVTLANAFTKLEAWHKAHEKDGSQRWFKDVMLDELVLSHPKMDVRKTFLADFEEEVAS